MVPGKSRLDSDGPPGSPEPANAWRHEYNEPFTDPLIGTFDGWRGNMYRLVVHPDRRRQGIARALVRHVEQVFAGWGVHRVTALVEVGRPWAASFWTAVGYPRDDRVVRHAATLDGSPSSQGPASAGPDNAM